MIAFRNIVLNKHRRNVNNVGLALLDFISLAQLLNSSKVSESSKRGIYGDDVTSMYSMLSYPSVNNNDSKLS